MQDPQSEAEVELLRQSVKHLVEQAKHAIDTSRQEKSSAELSAYRGYLAIYEEALRTMTQDYINTRLSYMPDIVEIYLTQTLLDEFDTRADFPRYARECLTAALEICGHESFKFIMIFANNWGNMRYRDQSSPVLLSLEKGKFKEYLVTIGLRVFDILQPNLQSIEISSAVELANWLNTHVHNPNSSGDLVSSHSDEDEDEDEETGAIFSQAKSKVAGRINNKIIGIIFGRIREILLRDVERYMGKSEDFVSRVPTAQSDSETINDGTSIRLEKALGLGIRGAYPPVKTACRLLVLVNDLTFEYGGENVSSAPLSYPVSY